MAVTLKHLINRLNFDLELLKKHPEHKDMLERKIAKDKQFIVDTICSNFDNPLLNRITVR